MEFAFDEGVDKRRVIFRFAFEGFHRRIPYEHVDVHSRARAVQSPSRAELEIIEMPHVAFEYKFERFSGVGRKLRRPYEIVARSAGYYPEIESIEIFYSVEYFVKRAVTAHDDKLRVRFSVDLASKFRCVHRLFGQMHFVRDIAGFQYIFDLFESGKARTFTRYGIAYYIVHIISYVQFITIILHSEGLLQLFAPIRLRVTGRTLLARIKHVDWRGNMMYNF